MSEPVRTLVALNGSPVRGSNVEQLLQAVVSGAESAGGRCALFHCDELAARPCVACGPDATDGYCIFSDLDAVYAALEQAHAVVVGSPIYFDTVSAQLKLVIDRCNCITPLVTTPEGHAFKPRWTRTRRAAFVTSCAADRRYDLAERTVRGFLKWIGARWQETLAWEHDDVDLGRVVDEPELLRRAQDLGRRLIEGPPLRE
jgi:NAD(P)H-dependent FMN reductase